MYMTLARIVNIGDTVMIADTKGKIIDITLSNVHLLNEDDDIVYIPNNNVFASQIINYTRRELKKSSIDFELDVAQIEQLEKLEKEGELKRIVSYYTESLQEVMKEFNVSFKEATDVLPLIFRAPRYTGAWCVQHQTIEDARAAFEHIQSWSDTSDGKHRFKVNTLTSITPEPHLIKFATAFFAEYFPNFPEVPVAPATPSAPMIVVPAITEDMIITKTDF